MLQEFEREHARFIYYTPRETDKMSQIWPVRGGCSTAKPHYKAGPKRIDAFSLHFVQEGAIWLEYPGHRVLLGKHDLFCMFPGVAYAYSIADPETPLRFRWIVIDGPRAQALLKLAGLTPEAPYRHQARPLELEELLDRMLLLMEDAVNWQPAVSLKLQSLLYGLFSAITPDDVPVPAYGPVDWIRECVEFMELHASEGVSVQDVASYAGVHRSYLTSVFTREVGMSPLGYLQKTRMDKAKRLLLETDATVTEIALSLGYPNLFSFTRAFKNYVSVSPHRFRSESL